MKKLIQILLFIVWALSFNKAFADVTVTKKDSTHVLVFDDSVGVTKAFDLTQLKEAKVTNTKTVADTQVLIDRNISANQRSQQSIVGANTNNTKIDFILSEADKLGVKEQ